MQNVVGIICEYNPFHKGHKYQIDQIRKEIPNATIVAIMSGNIVQRGEMAIINKYDRAQIALECGVNAVFELPYPYSGSTAEVFARAGVDIAHKLCCEYLYFGTESKDIFELEKIAELIDSAEFEKAMSNEMENKSKSYIACKESALLTLGYNVGNSANDLLAIEYIRAIKKKKLKLKYRAIKRVGAGYNSQERCEIMSASAIRKIFDETRKFVSVPNEASELYERAVRDGKVLDYTALAGVVYRDVLLHPSKISSAFDTTPEMVSLITKEAKKSRNSLEFYFSLSSKICTTARIKRSLLYSLFDIKRIAHYPSFTVFLGADEKGKKYLNKIKKIKKIHIITKHSDGKNLCATAKKDLERNYLVDCVHNTLLEKSRPAEDAYKNKPIIKK